MKFVCNGLILSDAALTVSKACAIKTIMPVLECIKLHAENDGLTLTAYDGEVCIEKKINAEIFEEGEICVNGKMFSDFVGKISGVEVVVSDNGNTVDIRYADSESHMAALSADEFPRIGNKMTDRKKHVVCKESDFKNLVSKVTFCAATDDSRPILKGCLVEANEGILYAIALDGFRMACSYTETIECSDDFKMVCPARTLTEISRMVEGDGVLDIYTENNLLSVVVQGTTVISKLYAGEFIKKENIFPVEFTTKVQVKKSELCESIERASVLIRGDKNNLIVLDIKNGKMSISANSEMGKVEETIAAQSEGKELKIAMNGKYVLEALKALEEEVVVLSFNTSISPFTIGNEKSKRDEYLVLPVRTSNQQA